MNQLYAYISATISCVLFFWARSKRTRGNGPLPPSPKSDPLIGNLRVMASIVDEPRAYRDWGMELGSDIISITIPGKVIIVLNSQEAIDELLNKRSAIYSDRPHIPMIASENLVGWGHSTGSIRYGERWRFQRKMTHEAFHKTECEARWPLLERQARLALQRMLANPAKFSQDIRCMAGSMMLTTVYGYEVTSEDDSLFKTVEEAVSGFSQALVVQNYLVNTFPWLEYIPEWFPGTEWKAKANEWRRHRDLMLHVPFEWTRNRMASTILSFNQSLTPEFYYNSDLPSAELEDCIRWASGSMFAAGITPVVNSIRAFIVAMAMHPDIQAKAQAEIDDTIGTRLPEIADWESLSYVRCIVKEVLRWKLTLPMAVPHACIQDDTYKGYFIPKGAIIIGNSWAISNNPAVYPEPDRFNPDRFLDPSVPDAPAFGYGRRICPGSFYSEAALFITAASILSVFDVRPEVDAEGNPIPPRAEVPMKEAIRSVDCASGDSSNPFRAGNYVPSSAKSPHGLKDMNK